MADEQIEGLPPDAVVKPMRAQAPKSNSGDIEGLPPGAIVRPIGKDGSSQQPTSSQPTQFEQDRTPQEGFLGAAWNDIKGAAKGVASMGVKPYTEAYEGYQEGGIGEGAKRAGMALLGGPVGSPLDNAVGVAEQNEREKKPATAPRIGWLQR